jgi:hypothetical protein
VQGEDHRYIDFFPNTPHGTWSNTDAQILHSFRNQGAAQISRGIVHINKGLGQWRPIASTRPKRETYFIGVSSVIPEIENNWTRRKLEYTTQDLTDAISTEIKTKVGDVLQRAYTKYHKNDLSAKRSLIGVEYQAVNYTALSMGAGEQRLFRLLHQIKAAGKYALILIDELDLLLHTDALHRLLKVLNDYAQDKKLQIVFTTHRESIVDFASFVAVRHLYRSPSPPYKTFCFNDTKPDALSRLTGKHHRPIQISCEDDIATAIIEKVARQVGLSKYIEISRFGSAGNCFTLAAALMLSNKNLDRSLFVLDGDNYESTEKGRKEGIKRALSGTEIDHEAKCQQALTRVVQFLPTNEQCPEAMLHGMIVSVTLAADEEMKEVIVAAAEVSGESEPKLRFKALLERLSESRGNALFRAIDVAAKSEQWSAYTRDVREWLESQKPNLVEAHA